MTAARELRHQTFGNLFVLNKAPKIALLSLKTIKERNLNEQRNI